MVDGLHILLQTRIKKSLAEFLPPFPAWGTGNASLPFLPTLPLLINFTVTFTKKRNLAIVLSGAGRGPRGRDGEGDLMNVQYKSI
jgi:hypothetical protein